MRPAAGARLMWQSKTFMKTETRGERHFAQSELRRRHDAHYRLHPPVGRAHHQPRRNGARCGPGCGRRSSSSPARIRSSQASGCTKNAASAARASVPPMNGQPSRCTSGTASRIERGMLIPRVLDECGGMGQSRPEGRWRLRRLQNARAIRRAVSRAPTSGRRRSDEHSVFPEIEADDQRIMVRGGEDIDIVEARIS